METEKQKIDYTEETKRLFLENLQLLEQLPMQEQLEVQIS